jgi:hypothetical protein
MGQTLGGRTLLDPTNHWVIRESEAPAELTTQLLEQSRRIHVYRGGIAFFMPESPIGASPKCGTVLRPDNSQQIIARLLKSNLRRFVPWAVEQTIVISIE